MRVVGIHETGGPEVLRIDELADPDPGPGQTRVTVEAAGVNFIDTYHRSGQYKVPLPFALGQEGAGTVEAVGPAVAGIAPGDRVAWTNVPGSYATKTLVPAEKLVAVPPGVDLRTAAAAMLQGLTAHYLAFSTYPLKPGDTCLIHAGAGGVGLLLTQMAKLAGARVITTAGTDEKADLSRGAGADEVIVYTREDFADAVKRITEGSGVQVVYDSVGRDTFERSLKCLATRGLVALFGQSSGAVVPFDPQALNAAGSLYLTRPSLGHYIRTREELTARTSDVFGWIATGRLSVRIGATFPLAEAAEAHRQLEGRKTTGKVLLLP